MREWASVNGAVARERSCRQETTMARAGTPPENAYFEELTPISSNQVTNTNEQSVEEELNEGEVHSSTNFYYDFKKYECPN